VVPYDPAKHGPKRIVGPGFHEQVHQLVQTVPPGSVTTYGDVAAALGNQSVARHVGYALAALPGPSEQSAKHDIPWWRVVAAGGRLSQSPDAAARQATLLQQDGVTIRNLRVQDFAERRHVFAAASE
jgi:methylated-DNA-protein-cysteine methyltransferase related protein